MNSPKSCKSSAISRLKHCSFSEGASGGFCKQSEEMADLQDLG